MTAALFEFDMAKVVQTLIPLPKFFNLDVQHLNNLKNHLTRSREYWRQMIQPSQASIFLPEQS